MTVVTPLPSTPKDYAFYYRNQLNLSTFIVRADPPADRKKPAVMDWKTYQNVLPPSKEIENWFRFNNGNYNVAVVTGNVSGIIALDIDGNKGKKRLEEKLPDMSTNLRVAFKNTMVNRTGSGGLHIIFKLDKPTELGQKVLWKYDSGRVPPEEEEENSAEIRLKANGGYIIMPPSIHPNGKRYEWNGKEPHLITTRELNEMLRLLSPVPIVIPRYKNKIKTSGRRNIDDTNRTLSNDKVQLLLNSIKPYYNPGSRNDIIFYLSGMMRVYGFSHDTTIAFIELLCNTSGYSDEDLQKSLAVVDTTYQKPLDRIKGKTGLYDVLLLAATRGEEDQIARGEAFAHICRIMT